MIWMKKISKIIASMDKKDWWICLLFVFSVWDAISLIQASYELKDVKRRFAEYKQTYRSDLVNELCNAGNGNYDFCILKKAEYTFVEKDKNPTIKSDTKNEKIEALMEYTNLN